MAQPKKRRLGCKLAVGALVFVVACALILTVINLVDTSLRRVGLLPTRTPTPTATFTPIPSDTPIPTGTSTPTSTPLPAISTSTSETVSEVLFSGGLGLDQKDWEQLHGEGHPGDISPYIEYENGKYSIIFMSDKVWTLECQWDVENAVSLDNARLESKSLIPTDSQFIRTYSPEGMPELTADLYLSESLKNKFSPWSGSDPGMFVVIYGVQNYGVSRMVIGTDVPVESADTSPAPSSQPPAPSTGYTGPYDPHGPDRDCSDFSTHAEAQAFYEAAGGPAQDPHRLDHDHNGIACEDLP